MLTGAALAVGDVDGLMLGDAVALTVGALDGPTVGVIVAEGLAPVVGLLDALGPGLAAPPDVGAALDVAAELDVGAIPGEPAAGTDTLPLQCASEIALSATKPAVQKRDGIRMILPQT